jgi:beta-glucosidase
VAHHLLRAHGAAVEAYRAAGRHRIGVVVNLEPKHPASSAAEDVDAARRADAYMNRQYLDPLLRGEYPAEMAEVFGPAWPRFAASDLGRIRQPIDFLGVNYYTRSVVRSDPAAWPVGAGAVRQPSSAYTETDWEVYPDGLAEILLWVKQRYGALPLYVTENGAAFADPPHAGADPDGEIADPARVAYLRDHLLAAARARRAGVDLRGYFVWSLLDNFEWSHGYAKRFGIVHVDYATQRRTPKASARFYARVIASRGAALGG